MRKELYGNRKHKDTVFRMLYSDKRAILELYNALNGTDYQNPDDLTITTLENAVYMAMKNDVSFLLDARMTLYEHQSTWNPNMPLRDLLYIARLMEKNVDKDLLYLSELVKIPAPHFVVFYNGAKEAPEDVTLRLSDAFIQKEEEPELELKVRYLNINQGCNQGLMKKCRTLREYSEFVARIRKYTGGKTAIGEAVDRAVTECIAEGILADFLRGQRAEVIAMSIFEYNEEEVMRKLRKGEQEIGEIRGKAKSVLEVLELYGQVPEYVRMRILKEDNIQQLSAWLREAAKAESIEDFQEKTGLKEPR